MQAEDRQLSDRERTVLLLAAEGLTDKEIARHLGLSKRTIATYWERLRQKLGSFSRTQLVATFLMGDRADAVGTSSYRGLFATWEEGVWILSPSRQTIYANQRVATLFGFEHEAFFEQDASTILRTEACLDLPAMIEAAFHEPQTLEISLKRPDGSTHWLRVRTSSVRDDREQCRAVVVLVNDLTMQRRIVETLDTCQSTLEFLSEHSSDLIARFDAELRCVGVNPTFRQVLGHSAEAVVGKPVTELASVFQPNERWVRCLHAAAESLKPQTFASSFPTIKAELMTFLLPEPSPDVSPRIILSMSVLQGLPALGK